MNTPVYCSYLLVGSGQARLWEQARWLEAVLVLSPLVESAPGDVGVRTSQHDAETGREPRFGRMSWDARSHRLWPLQREGRTREFFSTEIWAPRWTVCERARIDPTLFVVLHNPHVGRKPATGQFNQLVQVTIEAAFQAEHRETVSLALDRLHALIDGVGVFVRAGPWNVRGDCHLDAISNHFHYPGLHEDMAPHSGKLRKEGWFEFEPGGPLPSPERWSAHGEVGVDRASRVEGPLLPDGTVRSVGLATHPVVYDKAKYHYGGDYPEDLPMDQAFVHTGMYLGWIIDHDMYSSFFAEDAAAEIDDFKARRVTGKQVYELWDGCLIDDMLNAEGNAFSAFYFDFENGQFLRDYENELCMDLPSPYHVEDTWENYHRLKARIDSRYAAWKEQVRR